MAMSAAERQRKYRESNRYQKDMFRINLWLQGDAHNALLNLSRHYGKSQSEMISSLLLEAQAKILRAIPFDDEARDRYWVTERSSPKSKGKSNTQKEAETSNV